jgi:hypothetical protein
MSADWIDDFKAWLWNLVLTIFDTLWDMVIASVVRTFKMLTELILYVLSKLPLPEFMQNTSLGDMLSKGGNTVMWFAQLFQLGPSMVMIGIAIVFYLLRRVLTIGIW